MVVICQLVIRGGKKPLVLLSTCSIALPSTLVGLSPTFTCADKVSAKNIAIKKNIFFILKKISYFIFQRILTRALFGIIVILLKILLFFETK